MSLVMQIGQHVSSQMQTSSSSYYYSLLLSLIPYIFYPSSPLSTPQVPAPYPSFLALMRLWLTILSYAEESTLPREQSATSMKVTTSSGCILDSWLSSVLQGLNKHSPSTAKKTGHTGELAVGVREGAFIPTILSHPPTHHLTPSLPFP